MNTVKFKKWIDKYHIPANIKAEHNLLSLDQKRKYHIPTDKKEEFFRLYTLAAKGSTITNKISFVFRTPKNELQPFRLDVDLHYETETLVCWKSAHDFCHEIAKEISHSERYCIVGKSEGYFKKGVYCTGFHCYFMDTYIGIKQCDKLRQFAIGILNENDVFGKVLNNSEDIIDKAVTHRVNGLLMIGGYKPGSEHKEKYIIRVCGQADKDCCFYYSREDFNDLECDNFRDLYEYHFGDYKGGQVQEPIELTRHEQPAARSSNVIFNLEKFLELTKSHTPSNQEYKQILGYLKTIGFDHVKAQTLCNKAWKYSSDETSRYLDKIQGGEVTKGSMKFYLTNYAGSGWNETDVWKIDTSKKVYFFNDLFDLFGQTIKQKDLTKIFSNTFMQIWGNGDPRFIYSERVKQKLSDRVEINRTQQVICSENPFKRFDRNITIKEIPPQKVCINFLLGKLVDLDPNALKKQKYKILSLSTEELLKAAEKGGLIYIKTKKLSVKFTEFVLNNQINNKRSFVAIPYLTPEQCLQRTPSDAVNIWPENPLMTYKSTESINIKKTTTWDWFYNILCCGDPYKLEWFSVYHREKLINANRKIEKILLLFSENTGLGKSSLHSFTAQVFGADHSLKVDTVADILKDKNSELLNKLFVYLDDAERLSKLESESLRSKCTEKTFIYRKLYSDGIQMQAFHDYIVTTNKKNCLYIKPEDRRIEIIEVCEEGRPKKFWDQFYRERRDPNVGKAFLDYFLNYKSDLDVRRKECRFSMDCLQKMKLDSMKITHRFLVELFEESDFFMALVHDKTSMNEDYFSNFIFHDNIFIVKSTFLWRLFKHWKNTSLERSQIKQKSFMEQLAEINIEKKRITLRDSRVQCFDLSFRQIKNNIEKRYKIQNLKMHNSCFLKRISVTTKNKSFVLDCNVEATHKHNQICKKIHRQVYEESFFSNKK
jgi:hypothetical protein